MSFEKELEISHGNTYSLSSTTCGMPIPPLENRIGYGQDSWTEVRSGIELVSDADPSMAPTRPMPMPMNNDGGVCNMDSWNTTPESTILQRNGIGQNANTWIPVTSAIPAPVEVQENQFETENWHDLIGMYTDLLQEKTIGTNEVYEDINRKPPPVVHYNRNQNWVAGVTNGNLNQMLNPVAYQNHTYNQPSAYNTSLTPMPGSQQTQRFASNHLISSGHNPKDGFPVNYGAHYIAGSPPRMKPDAAAASHITNSFPFAPITPDNQRKQIDSQRVQEKNTFLDEEASTQAENMHGNQTVSTEDAENLYNELLQTIGSSPPSAISTTQKDNIISEDKDEHGINLENTPNQKTPTRRKKHRPKVIREGKPKRTPKDPRNVASGEIRVKRKYVKRKGVNSSNEKTPMESIQKRKYVRRKGVNSSSQINPADSVQKRKYVRKKGVDPLNSQQKSPVDDTKPKSCKKQLNFDWVEVTRNEGHDSKSSQLGTDVPSTHLDEANHHGLNALASNSQQKSTVDDTKPKSCKKQLNFDWVEVAQNEGHASKSSQLDTNVPSTHLVEANHHGLNALASYMTTSPKPDRWENTYNTNVNGLFHGNGMKTNVFQADMSPTNLQCPPQSITCEGMVSSDEKRGIKRQSCEQMPNNVNAMNSLLLYQKNLLLGVAKRAYNRSHLSSIFLENHKKIKMQSEFQDNSRQMKGIYGNRAATGVVNSSTGRIDSSNNVINVGGNGGNNHFMRPMAATHYLLKRQLSSGIRHRMIRSIPERSQKYSQGAMISWNPPPQIPPKGVSRYAVTTCPKLGPNLYNQRLSRLNEMLQQRRNNTLRSHQLPFTVTRGAGRPRKQRVEVSVDVITHMLERLHIYDGNKKQQNGLVLYRGSQAIIPFVPIKKRNRRPKVDLDPETERLWNLLMGNGESDGTEKLDKDKEKWWENERQVFRGRTDSFIARMHLVQGDRRFSRWKGSVVDSVIGVFLTQNVSDHLSSSAFMSLAAKFPPKSKSTPINTACCQDDTIKCQEEIKPSNSSENMPCQISSTRGAENKHSSISEEEVILSQDSFDSSIIQTVGEYGSSSGSNSEEDDVTTGFETSKQSSTPQEEISAVLNDHVSNDDLATNMHHPPKEPASDIQIPEMNGINLDNASSQFNMGMTQGLPSSNSGVTDAYHTSNVTYPQNELPKFQTPSQSQYNTPTSLPRYPLNTNQHAAKCLKETRYGPPKQVSATFGGIPIISVPDGISVVNKQNCFENTASEANSREQNASSAPLSKPGPNIPKARKETPEDERKRAIDWDSLRKQALSNGEKKERSNDAKDTIDYEELRHAKVNEISDAIKERGMNNLLADRMKEFLNRLVKDHGSVDLEWLRDAPPDKAKDYLLSFRGLGLKSVECVRLLTLHHLAFPVDTNVGRIAVRLGWVPLQPLPESLQLHLLEMYPVLESIQKYLWPRLCKLDQLTLYELHYQMITFGKVFCTKSKPNCNACPMRAECRHFASAFASARLSLPGPEEKRIVISDDPVKTDPISPVVIRPMPLPPAENESNKGEETSGNNCEPIIEEPTTPEPEANELSISDIEDQYYEDSDEIPVIKLNMEEFTTNLQNMMQDSKDMSKALVALNPKVASIPTPKLKDVSRLRTEHLVYELPDSHQLLEGLDKREPDDPSPYLLAIWTPGETANSVQAPIVECLAQKSGQLCDQTTCFSCNSVKEANLQVVRGTILIPCRTAMRGSFPLNGTYFQVNEMFADHASSLNPIDVPRTWIWNLPRRKVYFGTSVTTIFKGLTTEGIQYCFWKGFVCVRGFDRIKRAPRPLMARLHFPASKLIAQKTKANK